jgi:hypothetical protein
VVALENFAQTTLTRAGLWNDADIIKECYKVLVQELFNAYWNNAFIGNPPASQVQQAEAKFKSQIAAARKPEIARSLCCRSDLTELDKQLVNSGC